MEINNDINILDSRVFADATHKNDRKRNADAIHKDDSQVCESDCTTSLSFLGDHFLPLSSLGEGRSPETRGSIMAQSGRSMTEMLGTLAIIGVLSVGAIGGYSYGMDKWRANTIMNDVMLRAVDVIAQFDRTGDANLNGWPTTTAGGYTIGLENETIGIQVDNLPERICEMVFDGMINQVTVKIGATEHDAPTDDDVCGDTNTMVFYVDDNPTDGENNPNVPPKEDKTCGDVVCGDCQKCDFQSKTCVSVLEMAENISDFVCTTDQGTKGYCGELYGSTGCIEEGGTTCAECHLNIDGECQPLDSTMFLAQGAGGFQCTKDGQRGYCMEGACVTLGDSSVCETNGYDAECMTNLGGTCFPSEGEIECSSDGYTGYCLGGKCLPTCDKCTDNQFCGDLNISCTTAHLQVCKDLDFTSYTLAADGKTYYVSNNPMSWWDADAACKALGKSLLSLDDLLTDWDETARINETKYTFTRNELAKELYTNVFGGTGDPIWTSDDGSSCNAFFVYLEDGLVGIGSRNINDGYLAVCW